MNRTDMFNKVVRELGHEHKATIWFIGFAEEHPDATDMQLERVLMALLDLINYVSEFEVEE